jgi:hypothetical protein
MVVDGNNLEMGTRPCDPLCRAVLAWRDHSLLQVHQSHETTATKLWTCRPWFAHYCALLLAGLHWSQCRVEGRRWKLYPGFNLDLVESLGCCEYLALLYCAMGLMPLQMIPILYLLGLGLLPRQWQQEAKQRSARRSPNVISNPRLQLNRFGV